MGRNGIAPTPIAERIHSSVIITPTGCWEWQKFKQYGYGKMYVGSWTDGSRRCVPVHRASYETFVGPIPDGLHIDHLCNNPGCVNPEHLEPVTPKLNAIRRVARAKGYAICRRGHRRTPANTERRRDGTPICLTCEGRLGVTP